MLTIPAGTQSGKRFRLKEKGVKNVQGFGYGDQYVTVTVVTPTKLSEKERDLFKQLAAENGEDISEQQENFIDKTRRFFKGE